MLKMKIKPQFLRLIRDGSKRHEYRLAKDKFANVKIGDEAILINSTDPYDYEKVRVNDIIHVDNWNDALKDNRKKDFSGYYETYDEVYRVCSDFYDRMDVKKYGINIFGVEVLEQPLKNIRVLIDDELIISHESNFKEIESLKCFYECILKGNCEKVIDSDHLKILLKSNNVALNKENLNFYTPLKINTIDNFEDLSIIDDLKYLELVFKSLESRSVDIFVTNNSAILNNAREKYLKDKVFSTEDFIKKFQKQYPSLVDYDSLRIEKVRFSSVNINDVFFDSLRKNYGGSDFNDWFNRKKNEECYIFKKEEYLTGFLYIKTEDLNEKYYDFEPTFQPKKRLKVGTFKINKSGIKLGERFIKIIIDNALQAHVDEIYVTLFEDREEEILILRKLLCKWGFRKWGVNKKNGESIFIKDMLSYDSTKDPKFNYPLISSKAKCGFLPIYDYFHDRMFPDLYTNKYENYILEDEAVSYALEKIYVTYFNKSYLNVGDLVLIYRIGSKLPKTKYSRITGIGIIQSIEKNLSKDDVNRKISNRSVFSKSDILELKSDNLCIMNVLFLKEFSNEITLNFLQKHHIIEKGAGCRLTTKISKEQFQLILNEGGIEKI